MSMQRWENWLHYSQLFARITDPEVDNPDWAESRCFFTALPNVILEDGEAIKLQDPAVEQFLSMALDTTVLDTHEQCLKNVHLDMCSHFIKKCNRPGMHGYDSTELDKLIALREAPNGWAELDRLISQISGRTFSALVERNQDRFLTHPEDHGLGGNTCFRISMELEADDTEAGPAYDDLRIPAEGFTSDPRYIMALIDQVIHREAITAPPEFDYKEPVSVKVQQNHKTLFEIPLKTMSGSELPVEGVVDQEGRTCYSVIEPQWREINWKTSDAKLMKVIADTAPAERKRHVKGSFMVEEMGL